jgi:hypothetical protein
MSKPREDIVVETPKNTAGKKVVNLKCRNPKCDSLTAIEIEIKGGNGQRLYQCTVCGHPLAINVGGSFNI